MASIWDELERKARGAATLVKAASAAGDAAFEKERRKYAEAAWRLEHPGQEPPKGPALQAPRESPMRRWIRKGATAAADALTTPGSASNQQFAEGFETIGELFSPSDPETGMPNTDLAITKFASKGIPAYIARRSKLERTADALESTSRSVKVLEQIPSKTEAAVPAQVNFTIGELLATTPEILKSKMSNPNKSEALEDLSRLRDLIKQYRYPSEKNRRNLINKDSLRYGYGSYRLWADNADNYIDYLTSALQDSFVTKPIEEIYLNRSRYLPLKDKIKSAVTEATNPSSNLGLDQIRDIALVTQPTDRRQFLGGLLSKMIKPIESTKTAQEVAPKVLSGKDKILETLHEKYPLASRLDPKVESYNVWDVIDSDTGQVVTRMAGDRPNDTEVRGFLKAFKKPTTNYRLSDPKENYKVHYTSLKSGYQTPTTRNHFIIENADDKDEILNALELRWYDEHEVATRKELGRKLTASEIKDQYKLKQMEDAIDKKIDEFRSSMPVEPLKAKAKTLEDIVKGEIWHKALTENVPLRDRSEFRRQQTRKYLK